MAAQFRFQDNGNPGRYWDTGHRGSGVARDLDDATSFWGAQHINVYAGDARTPARAWNPPGSDLEPYLNDRLSDCPQAGVVVTRVRAYALVGLVNREPMALGGDPLGLFNDDP